MPSCLTASVNSATKALGPDSFTRNKHTARKAHSMEPLYKAPAKRVDRISFGKPTHHYVDANGLKIPGVTTILSEGLPKPALVNWAGNTTAAYAVDNWEHLAELKTSDRLETLKKCRYEDRDQAAKRGTEVHEIASRLILGQTVTVPDELQGHVSAYVNFLDDWEPEPIAVERTVVNYRYGYAGTFDLIYRLPNGLRVLADIKTTRSGIYGETALQLAAYRFAEVMLSSDTEEPLPEVDLCVAIWVHQDGYRVYNVKADEETFMDFRRVLQVSQVVKRLPSFIEFVEPEQ
jgi:hypothetical protein